MAAAGSQFVCADTQLDVAVITLSLPCRQVRQWAGPDPLTLPANSGEQAPPTLLASCPRTLCLTEMHVVTHELQMIPNQPSPTHTQIHTHAGGGGSWNSVLILPQQQPLPSQTHPPKSPSCPIASESVAAEWAPHSPKTHKHMNEPCHPCRGCCATAIF